MANGAPAIRAGLEQLAAEDSDSLRYFEGAFMYAGSPYARFDPDWRWWTERWASATAWVKGTVAYDEPLPLPHGAVVHVMMEDVTLADAPAIRISEQMIRSPARVPVPFALSYDPSALVRAHEYAVGARIDDADGRLLWTNGARYPVDIGGHRDTIAISVQSVQEFFFDCGGVRLTARIVDRAAQFAVAGRYFTLAQRSPAPATEYASASARFVWQRPDRARFELDGKTYADCQRVSSSR